MVVGSQGGVMALHVFNPDHNLYCIDCSEGELAGDRGMIPGDGGASGLDFSPMYRDDRIRAMYDEHFGLSEFEESHPDYQLRKYLNED